MIPIPPPAISSINSKSPRMHLPAASLVEFDGAEHRILILQIGQMLSAASTGSGAPQREQFSTALGASSSARSRVRPVDSDAGVFNVFPHREKRACSVQ